MRLSQGSSTYPGYKRMCFVYISHYFREEQNALTFNRDTWCYLALYLQMLLLHLSVFIHCYLQCYPQIAIQSKISLFMSGP
jgi:hypothetical protein